MRLQGGPREQSHLILAGPCVPVPAYLAHPWWPSLTDTFCLPHSPCTTNRRTHGSTTRTSRCECSLEAGAQSQGVEGRHGAGGLQGPGPAGGGGSCRDMGLCGVCPQPALRSCVVAGSTEPGTRRWQCSVTGGGTLRQAPHTCGLGWGGWCSVFRPRWGCWEELAFPWEHQWEHSSPSGPQGKWGHRPCSAALYLAGSGVRASVWDRGP